ncbi:hypothetical protein M9H77_12622 [Catharanthus roseus]|uniref:Uncharacterized protein n=1 Tax=Catharanthus roseus TaxID=4058 RepID=A0ACC0BI30_CATRO|nr:hypothetical protein M9H77_12622 [Catharanthus roseus]
MSKRKFLRLQKKDFYSTLKEVDEESFSIESKGYEYLITLDTLAKAYGIQNSSAKISKKSNLSRVKGHNEWAFKREVLGNSKLKENVKVISSQMKLHSRVLHKLITRFLGIELSQEVYTNGSEKGVIDENFVSRILMGKEVKKEINWEKEEKFEKGKKKLQNVEKEEESEEKFEETESERTYTIEQEEKTEEKIDESEGENESKETKKEEESECEGSEMNTRNEKEGERVLIVEEENRREKRNKHGRKARPVERIPEHERRNHRKGNLSPATMPSSTQEYGAKPKFGGARFMLPKFVSNPSLMCDKKGEKYRYVSVLAGSFGLNINPIHPSLGHFKDLQGVRCDTPNPSTRHTTSAAYCASVRPESIWKINMIWKNMRSLSESRHISTASTPEFKRTYNATVELYGQSLDHIMRSSETSSGIS